MWTYAYGAHIIDWIVLADFGLWMLIVLLELRRTGR